MTALLTLVIVLAAGSPSIDAANLDERVMSLSRELRCLVCQNETLADSRAELAADLRREIREMMESGKTDAEITAFLTSRYGDFILYRPPFKPVTLILWCGPFLMLITGMFGLYRYLKRQAPES